MKKLLFFLLLLTNSYGAIADNIQTLSGTIGKLPIYFEFSDDPGEDSMIYDTRYFYSAHLRDIVLDGYRNGQHYSFYAGEPEKPEERFELIKQDDGTFRGTWNNSKGKKLPVYLRPLVISSLTNPYSNYPFIKQLRKEDLYNYARSCFMKFHTDSVNSFQSKTFIWVSEMHGAVPFFRLGPDFDTDVASRINPILTNIHLREGIVQLSCSSRWNYNGKENGIEYRIHIGYLDLQLLGFEVFSSWDCGGAHPDFGGQGYLLDLVTGKNYDLDDILAFDKSVTTEQQSNFEAFSTYRSRHLAPQLLELLNATYHFDTTSTDSEQCNYNDPELWVFPGWNFTEKGIEFRPSFPRVARMCEELFLIPFSKLKKYKHSGFPYPFPE